jgi:hypothetical protein
MLGAEIEMGYPAAWRRWFAFLGAGIAWTFHLLAIYAIGEFGCVSGWGRITYMGLSAVAWMILLVSVVSLAVALAGTAVGYWDSRFDSKHESPPNHDEGGKYLSSFGWILSAIFSLIIFVESLPVFGYLHGC